MDTGTRIKCFLVLVSVLTFFLLVPKGFSYVYILTENVADRYPAKLPNVFLAYLTPQASGRKVEFTATWLTGSIIRFTDPDGKADFNVTLPSASSSQYSVTFSSPESEFAPVTKSFMVYPGIIPSLSYATTQCFDPESESNDILINAEAINTQTETSVTLPTWNVVCVSSPVGVRVWIEPLGAGRFLFKIGLISDIGGTYVFQITPSYLNYYSIMKEISIYVALYPYLRIRFVFSDGTQVNVNEVAGTEIDGGASSIDVYIYNTKGALVDGIIENFKLITGSPEGQLKTPQKIELGHFKVYHSFTEAFYEVTFTSRYGSYQAFSGNLKVSTIKQISIVEQIIKFLYNPVVLIVVLVVVLIVGWGMYKLFKKKKPVYVPMGFGFGKKHKR